jgi:hypothetical protein
MKRTMIGAVSLAGLTMLSIGARAYAEDGAVDKGANRVRFHNLTDDSCQLFLNDVYRGNVMPGDPSDYFAATRDNIKPLNIALRCSDGGYYAMQLEAIYDTCTIVFDEEGGGIRTEECTGGVADGKSTPASVARSPDPLVSGGEKGVRRVRIISQLDDRCGVWINGALAARLEPVGQTEWLQANLDTINRTNVLIRCSDGGVYGTSIEAIYDSCTFELDEEGGGLSTQSCQ